MQVYSTTVSLSIHLDVDLWLLDNLTTSSLEPEGALRYNHQPWNHCCDYTDSHISTRPPLKNYYFVSNRLCSSIFNGGVKFEVVLFDRWGRTISLKLTANKAVNSRFILVSKSIDRYIMSNECLIKCYFIILLRPIFNYGYLWDFRVSLIRYKRKRNTTCFGFSKRQ